MSAPESPEAAANRERLLHSTGFNQTDAGNAETLEYLFGDRIRYNHSIGQWMIWNGRYWAVDETGEVNRLALQTARQRLLAGALIHDKHDRKEQVGWAVDSESTFRIKAMLTIDLITRATDVPYIPDAPCKRWQQFLLEVFLGDAELIRFVQRAVGYSLTGDTREQVLFILHGSGSNGKTTFLEILLKLVGTHGAITSFSTFLVQQNPGSPRNDIAKLHGARLVKATESQKQAVLDEATVKEVTGGDSISARFLFREFFEFRPQFKIWLATNHRPTIRGMDDAIWRRIRLIPFRQKFDG